MDLKEFRDFITAQRLAEITEKRNSNLTAILSVATATITETQLKELMETIDEMDNLTNDVLDELGE